MQMAVVFGLSVVVQASARVMGPGHWASTVTIRFPWELGNRKGIKMKRFFR